MISLFSLHILYTAFIQFEATTGHSWVEQVSACEDRMFQHLGFPRGNVLRDSMAFLQLHDSSMTHLLPPNGRANVLYADDPICKPSQQFSNQTSNSPMLLANQSSQIVLRYQENGHVTLPRNTPGKESPGLVYIYGTNQSLPTDAILSIHKVWDEFGTGGDRRGRLLTVTGFDDGECYSPTNSTIFLQRHAQFPSDPEQGANRWCRNVVQLPSDVMNEIYTLYWVWDWPTTPDSNIGLQGSKIEIYTTCIDIGVGSAS